MKTPKPIKLCFLMGLTPKNHNPGLSSNLRTVRMQKIVALALALVLKTTGLCLHPVRLSPSLQVFRSRLKTELFAWSYSHDYQRLIVLTTIT